MADYEEEMTSVRNKIVRIESALEEEVNAINSEASVRIVEAVRRTERLLAPLHLFLRMANEAAQPEGAPRTGGTDTRNRASPSRTNATGSRGVEPARWVSGKARSKSAKPATKKPSARRMILEIIEASESPVPFPRLDHAVIDAGMTRSAGEKSRRTMERSGLVEREGLALKLTDAGRQALAAFRAEDQD